jgi:hypothetical protein
MGTKRFVTIVALVLLVLIPLQGNSQVIRVPPYTGSNYLNNFIAGDTLGNGQRRDSSAIYELQRGGYYLVNAVIRNIGWTLRIKANDTTAGVSKPVVFLYPASTGGNPPGQFVDMRGDLFIKNVIMSGYFEFTASELTKLQGALFNMTAAGKSLTLDSCILTNTNGNHVRTDQAPKTIRITNCIFANMGYLGRSNLGAGKGMDVRGGSVDTLIVVNNTFVNWQDRIIRHFASTANIQYLKFEHNTCVNGMSYHGFLSLGRVGRSVDINDNLLVDPFAAGQDTDAVRQAEFTDNTEKDAFNFARMTWIFSVPNDTTTWTVKNNYYRITAAGQAFFDSASILPIIANPPLVKGSPLTYHINSKLGADSATAFLPHTADLPNVPNLMTELMKWYRRPFTALPDSGANKTKQTSMWFPRYDFDRRGFVYLRDSLNCAYSTGNAVYTAGTNGYPVGDLNWFPAMKARWEKGLPADVEFGGGLPEAFRLEQNYPNPFNPSTIIAFSLPRSAKISLVVYDLLGRQVATLINSEVRGAGKHEATFSAAGVATGIYFYRLTADAKSAVMKMMVIK